MAHVLILANHDARLKRIKDACAGWDADIVLNTAPIEAVTTLGCAAARSCDVVILDHVDPVEPSLQAIQQLRDWNGSVKVIVAGIPDLVPQERTGLLFSYLEAGAAGYVAEDQVETQMVQVIQKVLQGGTWIEPSMTIQLIDRMVALHDALQMMKPYYVGSGKAGMLLTRRQEEVLGLLASGFTNKEIAKELFISVGTVKNHVHRILDVLNASTREQATQYYQFLQTPSAA
ncbi:hypothetical protein BH23CHL2_BH23CHL2_27430 [soil metagenome]